MRIWRLRACEYSDGETRGVQRAATHTRTVYSAQPAGHGAGRGAIRAFTPAGNGQDSSERYTSIFTADPERCLWFAPIVLDLVETIEPIAVRLSAIGV